MSVVEAIDERRSQVAKNPHADLVFTDYKHQHFTAMKVTLTTMIRQISPSYISLDDGSYSWLLKQ